MPRCPDSRSTPAAARGRGPPCPHGSRLLSELRRQSCLPHPQLAGQRDCVPLPGCVANQRRRFGYRSYRRQFFAAAGVQRSDLSRIAGRNGLTVRKRRVAAAGRQAPWAPIPMELKPNGCWFLDFASSGRKWVKRPCLRVLNIVEARTKIAVGCRLQRCPPPANTVAVCDGTFPKTSPRPRPVPPIALCLHSRHFSAASPGLKLSSLGRVRGTGAPADPVDLTHHVPGWLRFRSQPRARELLPQ